MKVAELLNTPLVDRHRDVLVSLLPLLMVTESGLTAAPVRGGLWFNQLYSTVKNLAVASKIAQRLDDLGIKGVGVERIKQAQQTAAKQVRSLLTNPSATAYRIPVWTTKTPSKTKIKIKMWNEAFAREFEAELSKIPQEML